MKKSKPSFTWTTRSHEETLQAGKELAKKLPYNSTVCLIGDLGAGKTTLSKGIIQHLTNSSLDEILSPTFNYVRTYAQSDRKVHHFDCYRLVNDEEFIELGLDDLLTENGVKLIEWPDRVSSLLPKNILEVVIEYTGEHERSIHLYGEI